MDIKTVRARVRHIKKISGDSEAAHADEDTLYVDFITHVAEHRDDELKAMAREVLKVRAMDFPRWYA